MKDRFVSLDFLQLLKSLFYICPFYYFHVPVAYVLHRFSATINKGTNIKYDNRYFNLQNITLFNIKR